MYTLSLRQTLLLSLLLTACQQQAQVIVPQLSPSPGVTASPIPTAPPIVTPTPTPTPPPIDPGLQNPPNINSLTEADVQAKKETLRVEQGWLSPAGDKLIYQLRRERRVAIKNSPAYPSARQISSEIWLLNHATGVNTRLSGLYPEQLYDKQLQWLDNQHILLLEQPVPGGSMRVVRLNPETGARTVLLDSPKGFSGDRVQDGQLYFMRDPGQIEALNLASGELSTWTLPQPLNAFSLELQALPGGKLILIDNRGGRGLSSGGPCMPAPCPMASMPPSRYVYQFDTATGQAAEVSSFKNGAFFKGDFLPSPDGRHLAWASPTHFVVVETSGFSEQVLVNNAEILGWLSDQHALLRYRNHLEVYDISTRQASRQIPLGVDDYATGYDSLTRQALIQVRGSMGSGSKPMLKTWDLSNPLTPGTLQTLPESEQVGALFPLTMPDSPGLILNQDLQAEQKALSLYRLKAQGLDKWLELPYAQNPDFSFAPAQTPNTPGTGRWELMWSPLESF